MYHHIKRLMYTVRLEEPDPRFGRMLLEQFGGANGELAAAMQYSVQGINCEDPSEGSADGYWHRGAEPSRECRHARAHASQAAEVERNQRMRIPWSPLAGAAESTSTIRSAMRGRQTTQGHRRMDVDLRSNIAAEARAKIVYERLINSARPGKQGRVAVSDDARNHSYEGVHPGAREPGEALPSPSAGLPRPPAWWTSLSTLRCRWRPRRYRCPRTVERGRRLEDCRISCARGNGRPNGKGRRCAADARGELRFGQRGTDGDIAPGTAPRVIAGGEAAGSCFAKTGQSGALGPTVPAHFDLPGRDRGACSERLTQCLDALGASSRSKTCKGMSGLMNKGQDVINENAEKDDVSADTFLVARLSGSSTTRSPPIPPQKIWPSRSIIRRSPSF